MVETTRRQLLAGVTGLLAAQPAAKPNLLYVFSDEHRACSMPGEVFNEAQAPNLARFASESVAFRSCISNYPVCSPYRAMLLTGRWPYATGIIDNALQLRPDEVSIGHVFQRAGYRTGYIGKWHLSPGDEGGTFIPEGPGRQGFDDWHVWSRTNQHFDKSFTFDPETGAKIQPKGYNCTLMTDQAVEFIGANRERPWMLTVSWNPPHPVFEDAPPEQKRRYDPASLKFRPNVKEAQNLRAECTGYYGHISAVDLEFGRLLRKLEETGQASNTIVIYTSDHGDMMGSHGFGGKRLPWEESCKVPFLVRYPSGGIRRQRVVEDLFSTIDIYPSLCGLAGLNVPSHCAGRDLSPVMRAQTARSPESSFLMHIRKENASGGENHPAPLFRGVRTRRHTYAVADDGKWLLYDNVEDPYQMHNLIEDAKHVKMTRDLDGLVLDWLKQAEDPFPFGSLRRKRSSART